MKTSQKKWSLFAAVIVLAGLFVAFRLHREDRTEYLGSKVLQGDIRDVVDATGTVNAVITVQVGSQVSGTIARLHADFNSRVHKGDVVAEIDPQLFQAAYDQAKANFVAAQANLTKAKVQALDAQRQLKRAENLAMRKLVAQADLDTAQATYDSAKAQVEAADSSVAQAKAALNQTQVNLAYTTIKSPIDGVVIARNVDVGQTVAASLQAPTIFTIAQDLTQMQVYAKIDESDVGRITIGATVSFKVDAFPKNTFRGRLSQIRMNPTMVQNVVTYDAIVDFQNPEMKLYPGMTAYVTIPVAVVENVVKLPNAALRFKPPMSPEAIRALYAAHGIEQDGAGASAEQAGAQPKAGGGGRRERTGETAVVWKLLQDHTIAPVQVSLGITDHAYTEMVGLISGQLKPGDEVVTTAVTAKTNAPTTQGIRR